MTFKRRHRGTVAATCAVVLVVLGACGGSRFRYVQNKDDQTFFKVPSRWGVLEEKPTKDDTGKLPVPWTRAFDAATDPSLEHVAADVPTQVAGIATVVYVDAATADKLSSSALRRLVSGLPDDPLSLADSQPDTVKLVSITVLHPKGGLKGSRIVYEMAASDGRKVTRDLTTMVDPQPYPNPNGQQGSSMFKVYVFDVRCESSCFEANKTQIASVIDSWQVIR
jgi:hypothetical protein